MLSLTLLFLGFTTINSFANDITLYESSRLLAHISKNNPELNFHSLSIRPNPVSVEIKLDEKYIGYRYNITDTHGTILTSAIYDKAIDIQHLAVGCYFISLSDDKSISIDKFIVVR